MPPSTDSDPDDVSWAPDGLDDPDSDSDESTIPDLIPRTNIYNDSDSDSDEESDDGHSLPDLQPRASSLFFDSDSDSDSDDSLPDLQPRTSAPAS